MSSKYLTISQLNQFHFKIENHPNLRGFSLAEDETNLYLYGGASGPAGSKEVKRKNILYRYDLGQNQFIELQEKSGKKKPVMPPEAEDNASWICGNYLCVFGGQVKEKKMTSETYVFHLEHQQWFKMFEMNLPPARRQPQIAQFGNAPMKTLIFGGQQLGGKPPLVDLWLLNLESLPATLSENDRQKKKELFGVWTHLEYTVSRFDEEGQIGEQLVYQKLSHSQSKAFFSKLSQHRLLLISPTVGLIACFSVQPGQGSTLMVFELDLSFSTIYQVQSLTLDLELKDIHLIQLNEKTVAIPTVAASGTDHPVFALHLPASFGDLKQVGSQSERALNYQIEHLPTDLAQNIAEIFLSIGTGQFKSEPYGKTSSLTMVPSETDESDPNQGILKINFELKQAEGLEADAQPVQLEEMPMGFEEEKGQSPDYPMVDSAIDSDNIELGDDAEYGQQLASFERGQRIPLDDLSVENVSSRESNHSVKDSRHPHQHHSGLAHHHHDDLGHNHSGEPSPQQQEMAIEFHPKMPPGTDYAENSQMYRPDFLPADDSNGLTQQQEQEDQVASSQSLPQKSKIDDAIKSQLKIDFSQIENSIHLQDDTGYYPNDGQNFTPSDSVNEGDPRPHFSHQSSGNPIQGQYLDENSNSLLSTAQNSRSANGMTFQQLQDLNAQKDQIIQHQKHQIDVLATQLSQLTESNRQISEHQSQLFSMHQMDMENLRISRSKEHDLEQKHADLIRSVDAKDRELKEQKQLSIKLSAQLDEMKQQHQSEQEAMRRREEQYEMVLNSYNDLEKKLSSKSTLVESNFALQERIIIAMHSMSKQDLPMHESFVSEIGKALKQDHRMVSEVTKTHKQYLSERKQNLDKLIFDHFKQLTIFKQNFNQVQEDLEGIYKAIREVQPVN